MKYIMTSCFALVGSLWLTAQVIIPKSNLPEIGDVFLYDNFVNFDDSLSYKLIGEGLFWSYDNFNYTGTSEDIYLDIVGTPLADSFPEANMIVEIALFDAAAIRTDSTIEIIGIIPFDLSQFGIETNAAFVDPFLYRKTPLAFGDQYADEFDFSLQFPSELIPGLDTIDIPFPGASLDSVRITTTIFRAEEASAWGRLVLLGDTFNVLKTEQLDTSGTKIEAGLGILGSTLWLDVTEFFGETGFALNQSNKTYAFSTPDFKNPILEFTEVDLTDTSGNTTVIVNGRIRSEIISAIAAPSTPSNHITLFPNPTHGQIYFRKQMTDINSADIFIYNFQGRLLNQFLNSDLNAGINISPYNPGTYLIEINTENKSQLKKIILMK